jgi:alpha-glucosidase
VTAPSEWWRRAVLYQVYLRSFQDSDGDGVGDLRGLIERLDYLNDGTDRSLGIDAIWLSPIARAASKDYGYDVVDHYSVDPIAGDMETFDRLAAECHKRGIRVVLDLVLNHTSIEHPWFAESRAARNSAKRDWYIWHDPTPDGGPPNNWRSIFGGSMWTFDEPTGQYYLHSYFAEQPDLNWRNPEVVSAMQDVVRFWLRRGVDGLRLDAVARLIKDAGFTDNPESTDADAPAEPQTYLHPDLRDAVTAIRSAVNEFPGRVAIGEVYAPPTEFALLFGDDAEPGLHLVFNHNLIRRRPRAPFAPWNAEAIAHAVRENEAALPRGALSCWAFGNHDVPRFASRDDADGRAAERSRAAALLLLGLRGVPCVYFGDELGMRDAAQSEPAARDAIGRDPQRAPMPWDASPGRGFTSGEPWLPFANDVASVAQQRDDPDSMLSLYRRAIQVRRTEPALLHGAITVELQTEVCVVTRHLDGARRVVIAVNTSVEVREVALPASGAVLLATGPGLSVRGSRLLLPGLGAAWLATTRP